MHYPLLNYVDGVSLERINFESSTNDRNNWHSAAESVGFGTPGVRNSQFTESSPDAEDQIAVEPEIFSPDNDGYNDIVSIKYIFEQPGYNMTVDIYDAHGRLVRKLVNNEYLGTSGAVNWDGIQDDNTKAPVGIYVFYIQIFDLNGNVKHYKKTSVLAAKL
jgi:gliding motility-associated-like protein